MDFATLVSHAFCPPKHKFLAIFEILEDQTSDDHKESNYVFAKTKSAIVYCVL